MDKKQDLSRFTEAHKRSYKTALEEIKNGRKTTHWMWYIFPQLHGFGHSEFMLYRAWMKQSHFFKTPISGAICSKSLMRF